ncbi:hypothetical protein ACLQ3J_10735 [Rhodococcus sp. DT1]|uniref:hypothetical protein n=1 Tax=Rhodococcus sp. DT1 TaxID=3416544 RepID=UPI003CEDD9F1
MLQITLDLHAATDLVDNSAEWFRMSTKPPLDYLIRSVDNALHRYVDEVLRETHGVGRGH